MHPFRLSLTPLSPRTIRLLPALILAVSLGFGSPTQPVVAGGGTIHFYVSPSAAYIQGNLCTDPVHPCKIEEVMAKVATDGVYTLHMAVGTYTYDFSTQQVDYQLTMLGPDVPEGSDPVVILDGENTHTVLTIFAPGHTIFLQNLVLQNGNTSLFGHGGGLLCNSPDLPSPPTALTLDHVVVRYNYSSYDGGGIGTYNCTLTITNSRIVENVAEATGGGIFSQNSAVTISDTIIQDNFANDTAGGGLSLGGSGSKHLDKVTIKGNHAHHGAGMSIGSAIEPQTITNSTISENIASGYGGGIFTYGTLTINNSTISNNQAVSDVRGGGGIYGAVVDASMKATLNLNHITLAGNTAPVGGGSAVYLEETPDGFARMVTENSIFSGPEGIHVCLTDSDNSIGTNGHNIGTDVYCGLENAWNGDQRPVNPRLGPLQDNGGPTFTQSLLPGSPAIDEADDAVAYYLPQDQRGVGRSDGNMDGVVTSDIGAYEYTGARIYLPMLKR